MIMPSVISFKPRKLERGFTIVEIIIVVAVIAILAAIALPAYNSFILRAKETAVIAYLGKVKKAQEAHRLEDPADDSYSGSFDELEATGFVEASVGVSNRVANEYQMDLSAGVSSGEPFWNIAADPLSLNPKARHFYIDHTGILRFAVGAPAGPGSQPMSY